jgi:PD-(D/E)XK nuclease superfamily
MLATWRCPKKFKLAHLQRYGAAGKSIHLIAGGAFAKGLEVARLAYCHGKPPEEALLLGTTALIEEYGDADSAGTSKSLDRMVGALEFYFSRYPLDADPARIARIVGTPAVEWSFALPLPFNHPETAEPLLYTGRTDAIVEFVGGLYGLDDKTTSSLGESWSKQWTLRSQFTGYAWAARTLGIPFQGVLVRGVSILKTKYDTAQAIINQPDWKIDRWVEHRNHVIGEMLKAYSTGYFDAALDETCNEYGACTFKSVCEVSPALEAQWLETNFVENEWSPLSKV